MILVYGERPWKASVQKFKYSPQSKRNKMGFPSKTNAKLILLMVSTSYGFSKQTHKDYHMSKTINKIYLIYQTEIERKIQIILSTCRARRRGMERFWVQFSLVRAKNFLKASSTHPWAKYTDTWNYAGEEIWVIQLFNLSPEMERKLGINPFKPFKNTIIHLCKLVK